VNATTESVMTTKSINTHSHSSSTPTCLSPNALTCSSVSKNYGDAIGVSNFSIEIQQGEIISLLGPSGCGKTTLLRLIGGFIEPEHGSITIGGIEVVGPNNYLPPEKRHIGMVFQEGALFPHLSVAQNVAYGLPKQKDQDGAINDALSLVGLLHLRDRMPHELSGGQQQRVALARALAPKPHLILLDEPFSNLDPSLREQVRNDMIDILKSSNVTAIFVTHDQEEALLIGDRVAIMNEGSLEQIGSAEEIFHYPSNRFTANFVGNVDFVPGEYIDNTINSDIGSVSFLDTVNKTDVLELMTRPDCLDCFPNPEASNQIIRREFRGAFYLYTVKLHSGNTVRCLLSHTQEFDIGEKVDIQLRPDHSLLPFKNGLLAATSSH